MSIPPVFRALSFFHICDVFIRISQKSADFLVMGREVTTFMNFVEFVSRSGGHANYFAIA